MKNNDSATAIEKLIHDVNSDLGAIQQALNLLSQKEHQNVEMIPTMLPLLREKIDRMLLHWSKIKKIALS
jgi:hypothetical protein